MRGEIATEKEILIETQDLCKSFGKRKVVDGINLKVEKGDIYGFLGPNGSGKTTTIKLLLDLIYPDRGKIMINGYELRNNRNNAISRVGAIVETPNFFGYMTGYQNLEYISGFYQKISKIKINNLLDIVNLGSRAHDKVSTYSLGMKQRLGIAAALINDPNLIILDEPTNGLDPQGIKDIREMILQLASEKGISFFISSHILHEIEQVCTKVSVLKQGKLIVQGNVSDLFETKQETIEIITSDRDKCNIAIKEFSHIITSKHTKKGVTISIDKGYSDGLIKYLVNRDVPIKYLIPKSNSLENAFLEIMEGGK